MRSLLLNVLKHPEYIYLFFASTLGVLFVFLLPPFAGIDEGNYFRRAVTIAYGHILNERVMVPLGIAELVNMGISDIIHDITPSLIPYTSSQYGLLRNIELQTNVIKAIEPSPLTFHHPFTFLPQAIVIRIGSTLGFRPLTLLYGARLAGMSTGIALMFLAIRIMPVCKYVLCTMALLPGILILQSYVNADAVTNGLCFLFTACTLRETTKKEMLLPGKKVAFLAFLAFVLAQCKGSYVFLPFLCIAIPRSRYASFSACIYSLLLIILPGILASFGYMLLMKHSYYSGISYHVGSMEIIPDKQMAFLLHHPMNFLSVIFNTLFCRPFFLYAFVGIFGDFNCIVFLSDKSYMICTLVLIYSMVLVAAYDTTGAEIKLDPKIRPLIVFIFLGVIMLSLVLLYLQFTGIQAPVVNGFQGKYLLPLLPLLCCVIKPLADPKLILPPWTGVLLIGSVGYFSLGCIWKVPL